MRYYCVLGQVFRPSLIPNSVQFARQTNKLRRGSLALGGYAAQNAFRIFHGLFEATVMCSVKRTNRPRAPNCCFA